MSITGDEEGMDAAARAELGALRRRAYSPEADIAGDRAALARLAELEGIALREASGPDPPDEPVPEAGPPARAGPEPPPRTTASRAPATRQGWHLALIAVTAAAALVLSATAWAEVTGTSQDGNSPTIESEASDALAFATDPEATVLLVLHLDSAYGSYMNPSSPSLPPVPLDEPRWESALGEYYGYHLWITGSIVRDSTSGRPETPVVCLVLTDGSRTRSRCVARTVWEQGALVLALSFDDLPSHERPREMGPQQSLGFWWTDHDTITVLLGRLD